jgi:hypothetical protein
MCNKNNFFTRYPFQSVCFPETRIQLPDTSRDNKPLHWYTQKKDLLIVCSGANDVYKNSSNSALKNITKFIKSIKNTNCILVCVPHRFDLADHSVTNNLINLHNSKLFNWQKIFNYVNIIEPICNTFLFTKHGLNIKGSGKELLSKQISICIYCR